MTPIARAFKATELCFTEAIREKDISRAVELSRAYRQQRNETLLEAGAALEVATLMKAAFESPWGAKYEILEIEWDASGDEPTSITLSGWSPTIPWSRIEWDASGDESAEFRASLDGPLQVLSMSARHQVSKDNARDVVATAIRLLDDFDCYEAADLLGSEVEPQNVPPSVRDVLLDMARTYTPQWTQAPFEHAAERGIEREAPGAVVIDEITNIRLEQTFRLTEPSAVSRVVITGTDAATPYTPPHDQD